VITVKSHQSTKKLFYANPQGLSIAGFVLFSAWLLAFPFEGQVLYAVAGKHGIEPHSMVFASIAAIFAGMFACGFLVKTLKRAKHLVLLALIVCSAGTGVFFFTPSVLWKVSLMCIAFLAGTCIASWGFFLKNLFPSNERIKPVADVLIYSNILMIMINMTAIHFSPFAGLALSILMLAGSFLIFLRMPEDEQTSVSLGSPEGVPAQNPIQPLVFLCVFIMVITINSGLMYQVINPAFAHHTFLVSWYWAVPYIAALFIVRNLPGRTNRTYILYVAIAMIGLSFVSFMTLDRSASSYLVVNTLMLGACGVYDLFWWSILAEMLDLYDNPARIFGIGLSCNVLGILIGGILGNEITSGAHLFDPSVLALVIVFIILIILPLLHKRLSMLLEDHVFLTTFSEMPAAEQTKKIHSFTVMGHLTERESEIAALLLQGRTYKMIAEELHLSENTVKTHIKNIYSKYGIKSKTELINLLAEKDLSWKETPSH